MNVDSTPSEISPLLGDEQMQAEQPRGQAEQMQAEQPRGQAEQTQEPLLKVIPTRMPVLELKVWCNSPHLKAMYVKHIAKHNEKLDDFYGDSGFDLLNPSAINFNQPSYSNKYPLGVKLALSHCALERARTQDGDDINLLRVQPQAFMLLPRSSTGVKKNIRLSNSVGVIDAGYRGELCALVDCISNPTTDGFGETGDERAKLSEGERNFQIVGYAGYPIHVNLVDTEEDLGNTERGTGGFGSTGN